MSLRFQRLLDSNKKKRTKMALELKLDLLNEKNH